MLKSVPTIPLSTHRDCVGRGEGGGGTQNTIKTYATFTLLLLLLLTHCNTGYNVKLLNDFLLLKLLSLLLHKSYDVIFNVENHHHSHPKFHQLLLMTSRYHFHSHLLNNVMDHGHILPFFTLENFKKNKIYLFSKFTMRPKCYV